MFSNLIESLKSALRSECCAFCQQYQADESGFCTQCLQELGFRPDQAISKSGETAFYSATLLTPTLKQVLYDYKFHQARQYSRLLSELLIGYWQTAFSDTAQDSGQTLILPVPARGKSISSLIPLAKRFSARFSYTIVPELLSWRRETQRQHTIVSKRQRYENVNGAMLASAEVVQGIRQDLPPVKRIILLDDLMTTGATLREAARALNEVFETPPEMLGLTVTHIPLAFYTRI